MKWAHKKSGMAFSGDFFSVDPARAGMILLTGSAMWTPLGGPRASGDDPVTVYTTDVVVEWTPRERG